MIFCLHVLRPIETSHFDEIMQIMRADSDFKFSEEYEEFRTVGREQSHSAAQSPFARGKNRYTNILPYDHSRVKLKLIDGKPGSEYVNANYIPVSLSRD